MNRASALAVTVALLSGSILAADPPGQGDDGIPPECSLQCSDLAEFSAAVWEFQGSIPAGRGEADAALIEWTDMDDPSGIYPAPPYIKIAAPCDGLFDLTFSATAVGPYRFYLQAQVMVNGSVAEGLRPGRLDRQPLRLQVAASRTIRLGPCDTIQVTVEGNSSLPADVIGAHLSLSVR